MPKPLPSPWSGCHSTRRQLGSSDVVGWSCRRCPPLRGAVRRLPLWRCRCPGGGKRDAPHTLLVQTHSADSSCDSVLTSRNHLGSAVHSTVVTLSWRSVSGLCLAAQPRWSASHSFLAWEEDAVARVWAPKLAGGRGFALLPQVAALVDSEANYIMRNAYK